MAYQVGDRIGDYQIIDVLGAGGMGKVYKVRNIDFRPRGSHEGPAAESRERPGARGSFHARDQGAGEPQHPNIAALHTALRINNQLIMLIEFVEGRTIEAELRNGPDSRSEEPSTTSSRCSRRLSYAHRTA